MDPQQLLTVRDLERSILRYEQLKGGKALEPRRLHNYILDVFRGGTHPEKRKIGSGGGKAPSTPQPKWKQHHSDPNHPAHNVHAMHAVDEDDNTPGTVDAAATRAEVDALQATLHPVPAHVARAPPNTPAAAHAAALAAPTPDTPATEVLGATQPDEDAPAKARRKLDLEGGNWITKMFRKKQEPIIPLDVHTPRPEPKPLNLGPTVQPYDPTLFESKREWAEHVEDAYDAKLAKYQAIVDGLETQLDQVNDANLAARLQVEIDKHRDIMQQLKVDRFRTLAQSSLNTAQPQPNARVAQYRAYLESKYPDSSTWPPEEDWDMLADKYHTWMSQSVPEGRSRPPFGMGGVGYRNANKPLHSRPPPGHSRPKPLLPVSQPLQPQTRPRPAPPAPPDESSASPIHAQTNLGLTSLGLVEHSV